MDSTELLTALVTAVNDGLKRKYRDELAKRGLFGPEARDLWTPKTWEVELNGR